MLYVVTPYLCLLVLLGIFQRSLLYHPSRRQEIRAEDALLPAGKVHTISTTTLDGLTLRGWHVLADGSTAETRGECDRHLAKGGRVVLYFSGNGGDRTSRGYDCKGFTELDADVFLFDYRGYGDNPGSPSEEGLAADAWAVWKYATQERNISPDRIVLFGESLGGGVATRLCAEVCKAGTPPAGLILDSTFSSILDTAAWHFPFVPVRTILWDRFESEKRIASVSCPLLQIHGTRDLTVPIELGRKLFAAAPRRSANMIEKKFLELPNAGHNGISKQTFRKVIGEFFTQIDSSR
jgi:fermentation-respiration switch protein FrsA (DUF1100 family)